MFELYVSGGDRPSLSIVNAHRSSTRAVRQFHLPKPALANCSIAFELTTPLHNDNPRKYTPRKPDTQVLNSTRSNIASL
jgi:hypothetical protein